MSETDFQTTAGRPIFPQDYGIPEDNEGLLPWQYVEERMTQARNYWIGTANAKGRPAVSPVWGVWLNRHLYFDGSPETRRGRNIRQNSQVVVHLESGDQVIILEGKAQYLDSAPDRSLAEQVAAAYQAKYRDAGYAPEPTQWDNGGLFIFTPTSVMAWTQFPKDTTRWILAK